MQEDLSRLIRDLKKETCPQRVHDEVQRRIPVRTCSPGWWRLAISFAVLMSVCGVSIWNWHSERNAKQAELDRQALHDRMQIAHQTEDALGLIGSVLAKAGADSGKVIYDRAVPP